MNVSVVIPVHNGAKWIRQAIESALANNPELVIVRDNASTDATWEILRGIDNPKVSVFKGDDKLSIGDSFQAVFNLASSEFVTIMGADDRIDADYLARVLPEFADGVAMVSVHPRFIASDGSPYANTDDPRLNIPKPLNMSREEFLSVFRIGNMYFGINTYRRAAVIEAGGFDPKAGWLIDLDLYTRLVKKNDIRIIEEELCSLTLSTEATSYLTTEKIPAQAQYTRYVRQKNFTPTKMKVIFATPFYMSQQLSHYGESLLHTCKMLTQAGVDWDFMPLNGDSYVDRAKNTIVANFLQSDGTDLIMIDSDEQWHPLAISRLLEHPEEIVAGAYPFKNNWGKFAGNPLTRTNAEGKNEYAGWRGLPDGSCLLEAYNIAGGFTRIKRSALEKYADAYPNDVYMDPFAWPAQPNRIYTAFFMCDIKDFHRYGEDAFFSRRMKECGVKLWIDANITITHYGMNGWTGNLHESLLKPPEELQKIVEEQKALHERMALENAATVH